MENEKQTYLAQVFNGALAKAAICFGLVFLVLGIIARFKRAKYDFGGWFGIGGGGLLMATGAAILLVCFLVPLFSKEKRRLRGL